VLRNLGLDVCIKGRSNCTALHFAARNGRTDVVKALVELGADMNARDQEGRTVLDVATIKGHVEGICALTEMMAHFSAA